MENDKNMFHAHLTDEQMKKLNSKCVVTENGSEPIEFDDFIVIGFNKKDEETTELKMFCYTTVPAMMIASDALNDAIKQAIETAPLEVKLELLLHMALNKG